MRTSVLLSVLLVGCDIESGLGRVNERPTVDIYAPEENGTLREGSEALLIGLVADDVDAPDTLEVTYSLDDGELLPITADADGGVNVALDLAGLELGPHFITVFATDADGDTGSGRVDFDLAGPAGAPTVLITAPADGTSVDIGTSITFLGEATDLTSGPEELTFAWSSSLNGNLAGAISGGGQSALITDALSGGVHVITLTVTDADGEQGADWIEITVLDEPSEPEPGDLIFTEVMVNPNAVADEDGEYVELYNTSGKNLDLAGYSFHDDGDDEWIFDAPVVVGPKSYIVICANIDPKKNGGVPCDAWFYRNPAGEEPPFGEGHGSGVAIANNDDELVLTSPAGLDIDVFDYNDTTSDPIEAGMGFGVDPSKLDGIENNDVRNWCVQTTVLSSMTDAGTPGVENDPCW